MPREEHFRSDHEVPIRSGYYIIKRREEDRVVDTRGLIVCRDGENFFDIAIVNWRMESPDGPTRPNFNAGSREVAYATRLRCVVNYTPEEGPTEDERIIRCFWSLLRDNYTSIYATSFLLWYSRRAEGPYEKLAGPLERCRSEV
jgi:hypothetical protein